ncbi:PucR family transcriptional regulator [Agromyces sp. CCNWLW203]|uniref:PucR family transcriptional regulator n=1 Tax=Agromyces sp. CCNWLW203 TaxID=3112842 RepID=UPI002F96A313
MAFEDLGRRVLAYSSVPDQLIDSLRTRGILNRLVPHSPFNDDQYRTVLRSEAPIKYPRLADEEPRVAFAIRAGALPLGTVWAIDASGNPDLTPEQDRRIRAAAEVAAGHMLDDIRVRSAGQMPREDRLRTLLTGQGVVGTELAELGISEERGAALLVFEAADGDHATTLAQLRLTVQRHLSLYREEAVTVAQSGRVYALFSGASAEFAESLAEPLLPILDRLIMPGTVVASPGAAHYAAGIAPLRELADRLLSTVKEHAVPQRILSVKKLRPLLIFERVSRLLAEQPELRSDAVTEMNESDPAVAETLLTWCGSFGNVAQAARSLGIHENTVRYRLRCAEERYGVDLSDPETLLVIWLQLRSQWFAERRASDRSAPSPSPRG